jgi:lipopolysaccharide/colanic/teichoic acid biosynthesis glycosyltransferase
MTRTDRLVKRSFDIVLAVGGLMMLWPVIGVTILVARHDTGKSGIFTQRRLGRRAKPFTIYKVRTMRTEGGSTVTAGNDVRITPVGAKLRKWKLDELPQLVNVLKGDMSFVGPRPDVPGYLDSAGPEWHDVLDLRPGITGPATLHFRDEEELLRQADDPIAYNNTVIWPKKLAINLEYAREWRFKHDIFCIWQTIFK